MTKIEYYVYELIEPDSDVFYVGKGSNGRIYQHVNDVEHGRVPNNNYELGEQISKILDYGEKVIHKKAFITDNEKEAFRKEKELIAEIGLHNLCNKNSGGDGGWTPSKETRQKLSEIGKQYTFSKEHRQNISKAKTGIPLSEKHKKTLSISHKGYKKTEKSKMKISGSKNMFAKLNEQKVRVIRAFKELKNSIH